MDDILTNAERIERKIRDLESQRSGLLNAAQQRAVAISNYDRAVALTTLKLITGQITKFENLEVVKVTATNTKDVAKGVCWRERLKLEEAEGVYKSLVSNIDCIKAELNGLQSINRHLA